jgi:hypothetical protein
MFLYLLLNFSVDWTGRGTTMEELLKVKKSSPCTPLGGVAHVVWSGTLFSLPSSKCQLCE